MTMLKVTRAVDFGGVGIVETGREVARIPVVDRADIEGGALAQRSAVARRTRRVSSELDMSAAVGGQVRQPADVAAPGAGVEAGVRPFESGLQRRVPVRLRYTAEHVVAGQGGKSPETVAAASPAHASKTAKAMDRVTMTGSSVRRALPGRAVLASCFSVLFRGCRTTLVEGVALFALQDVGRNGIDSSVSFRTSA